ncbi:O-antigen ligase family protein [Novosphingobium sp. RD2P27]|uniref:O-antigen ligase family protein n=1 Tax=Novosphingobium kalidii TaxID=3230299 RepID=A0ABV2D6B3_9SPHN
MKANFIARAVFVLLCAIIMIGTSPLGGPDPSGDGDGGGNIIRQIPLLLLMFTSFCLLTVRGAYRGLLALPIPFWIFFGWALLTLTWSANPEVGLRRYILTFGETLSLCILLRIIGVREAIRLLASLIFVLLIIDLLAVAAIPNAVHRPGEADRELIGLWKGIHSHKNIAASVASVGIFLGLTRAWVERSTFNLTLAAVSVVMLVGTGSKTSMAMVPLCLLALVVILAVKRFYGSRLLLRVASLSVLMILVGCFVWYWAAIYQAITEPQFFTGRGMLWKVSLDYSAANPFGAGYGSFWDVGLSGPATETAGRRFAAYPHGHNGYFDTLVSTGWVGLFTAIVACMVWPLSKVSKQLISADRDYLFATAFLLYFLVHNVTEPSIFSGTRVEWPIFIVCVMLFQASAKRRVLQRRSSVAITRSTRRGMLDSTEGKAA